jgi:Type I phosphodiesterase / nucleotide pyrophosphatase
MSRPIFLELAALAVAASAFAASVALADNQEDHRGDHGRSHHVLLISIDGIHALDFQNCVASKTCPNMAALGKVGVNYTRTSTSKPSDSFPGLMALVTGGTPKLVGAFYDVAYDRVLAPPAADTGNGILHGNCVTNQPNGTRTEYEEGDDIDKTQLNGGSPAYSKFDGGPKSLDPAKLVRDPYNACLPVYPWNFIRANTIFGVIHRAGGFTAWSDKHAAYSAVSGPTGTSLPSNLDDYYSPDINSNLIPLPGVKTAGGLDCSTIPNNNGGDWTGDFDNVKCNDQLKVNAVLNWIDGKTHLGDATAAVPQVFGMDFQAVSVGQKLLEKGVKGGYTDAAGTPTASMLGEIEFVDGAIGQFVNELKKNRLYDSTTIIITAKHGQSPVDTHRFFPIPGPSGANGTPPSGILGATFLPDSELNQIGPTEDDISLLWLRPGTTTLDAVNLLETNSSSAGIGQILYGPSLETMFNAPGLPSAGGDPRTPDIIVVPNVGVVYTGSSKKQAEHGGFALDDTNVMLLVSNPSLEARTVTTFVETTQVAPTILEVLGLDPSKLDAVRKEGTAVLPGFED